MGRRKIEIQPITHERNRSVTFLKRKNGLFKKAYELGVLCSVDVAVIIFEERPGHHLKLFQYCSTDVNSMVQRHIRFDGERDTRGPPDFSGNSKVDNADDDDDDGEDDDGTRTAKARQATSKTHPKVKTESTNGSLNINGAVPIRPVPQSGNDLSMIDLDYRTGRLSPTGSGSSMTIPVSGERLSAASPPIRNISHSLSAKRPRLDDPHIPGHAQGGMPALPQSLNLSSLASGAPGGGGGGLLPYPYRLEVDMSSGYPVQTGITPLPPTQSASHPSLQYAGAAGLSLGMNGIGLGAPPGAHAGFLPQNPFSMDVGAHHHHHHHAAPPPPPPPLRTVSFPGGQGHSGSGSGSGSPYTPHQTPASMQGAYPQSQRSSASTSSAAAAMAMELLGQAAGDAGGAQGGQGELSFDWPVHHGQQDSGQQQQQQQQQQQSGDASWIDFLSGSNTSPSSGAQPGSLFASLFPSPTPGAGRAPHAHALSGGGGGGGARAFAVPLSQTGSPAAGQKRAREDDAASVHSMHSAHGGGGGGDAERQRSEERASASTGRRSVSVDNMLPS